MSEPNTPPENPKDMTSESIEQWAKDWTKWAMFNSPEYAMALGDVNEMTKRGLITDMFVAQQIISMRIVQAMVFHKERYMEFMKSAAISFIVKPETEQP